MRGFLDGFEERNGYAPDINEIRTHDAGPAEAGLPAQARAFFDVVEELSWPDVWNGYFLGPAGDVVRRYRNDDPGAVMVGTDRHRALAIGSDGGGSYFVIDVHGGGVVLHVLEPFVRDGVIHGDARVVAADLDGFLESLVENVGLVAGGQQPRF